MNKPVVWTIAGSDSGGCSGIQSDVIVMNLLGVHACSIVTAVTAQNRREATASDPLTASLVRAQFDALRTDLPPAAVKTGMLATREIIETVVESLSAIRPPCTICDPVLFSSSGTTLLEPGALHLLSEALFQQVNLLTPNLPEAGRLFNLANPSMRHAETLAERALSAGVDEVLIKGGHDTQYPGRCRDFWTDGSQRVWLSSPRVDTAATRGTGCLLSASIAAARALGYSPLDSIILAKSFLNQGLRQASESQRSLGPPERRPWEGATVDLPLLSNRPDLPGERACLAHIL